MNDNGHASRRTNEVGRGGHRSGDLRRRSSGETPYTGGRSRFELRIQDGVDRRIIHSDKSDQFSMGVSHSNCNVAGLQPGRLGSGGDDSAFGLGQGNRRTIGG